MQKVSESEACSAELSLETTNFILRSRSCSKRSIKKKTRNRTETSNLKTFNVTHCDWRSGRAEATGLRRPKGSEKSYQLTAGQAEGDRKKAGSSSSRHRGAHTDAQKHVWQSRQRSTKPRLRRNCTEWLKTKSAARVKTAFTNFSFDK